MQRDGTIPYWDDTAIIITWDDWGGWTIDETHRSKHTHTVVRIRFRVPLIVVSAYTPAKLISNTPEDFGSLVRFNQQNFGIMEGALTFADARGTGDLTEFFNLGNPRKFKPINAPLSAKYFLAAKQSGIPPDDD